MATTPTPGHHDTQKQAPSTLSHSHSRPHSRSRSPDTGRSSSSSSSSPSSSESNNNNDDNENNENPAVPTQIYTYHCPCAHLLAASTTELSSLPRRKNTSDRAIVLPLPLLSSVTGPLSTSSGTTNDEYKTGKPGELESSQQQQQQQQQHQHRYPHYALLFSAIPDRRPVVVRCSNGFETRYGVRCARCRVLFGYQLDWAAYEQQQQNETSKDDGGGGGGGLDVNTDQDRNGNKNANADAGAGAGTEGGTGAKKKKRVGRRADLIYILPQVLLTTDEMKAGASPGGFKKGGAEGK